MKIDIFPRRSLLNPELWRPDAYASSFRAPGKLWLDKNENLDPSLLAFTSALLRKMDALSLATYPDLSLLYKSLANWVGVDKKSLLLTPGSDGAIRMTFEVFINERDAVIHTAPTFAMYPVYCQMFGATSQPIEYRRGTNGPVLGLDSILMHIGRVRPRLVCLPNPDSPTGSVLAPDELKAVVDLCGRLGSIILVDEAYHPFYTHSCVKWTENCPHLVVARTFAKAWGLAGLRIGYLVGHPNTMQFFHKMRPMYEVGTLGATVISQMLNHVDQMEASVDRLGAGKRYFVEEMNALGLSTIPTEGNFQHVAFGRHAENLHEVLDAKVLYRKDFKDECLRGYSRFSMTTVEQMRPIVESMRVAMIAGEGGCP